MNKKEMIWNETKGSWERVVRINNKAYVVILNTETMLFDVVKEAEECATKAFFTDLTFRSVALLQEREEEIVWSTKQ